MGVRGGHCAFRDVTLQFQDIVWAALVTPYGNAHPYVLLEIREAILGW